MFSFLHNGVILGPGGSIEDDPFSFWVWQGSFVVAGVPWIAQYGFDPLYAYEDAGAISLVATVEAIDLSGYAFAFGIRILGQPGNTQNLGVFTIMGDGTLPSHLRISHVRHWVEASRHMPTCILAD